ncbi:MAG: ribosome biogenesis GTPase Der [Victivallales bacterium]|nr:ribosome biogenesis GTPase Der [Victivallales bacterium]
MSYPVIAIVGRPNVGKSALFNCILGKRISIVHEQSGVTRDRIAAPGNHFGRHFLLVDTGGLGTCQTEKKVDLFDGMIREQVAEVVAEASVLIWVLNCQEGITPQDEEVGDFLRKTGKPVVIAANKADNADMRSMVIGQFARLGYHEIVPTSCTHTTGASDVMDAVFKFIPEEEGEEAAEVPRLKIAVVGRPNVGKSSLVNRFLGEKRVMVSDIAGTTRDAIDIPLDLTWKGETIPITLIDTAGMRRKKQIDTVVEFFSLSRAESAIKRCDLVLFMIDATDPCTTQERRIGRVICDARKACILLANKWDLASKDGLKERDFEKLVRERMPFMAHAPLHVISVINGYHFNSIVGHLVHVREQMQVSVPTGVFNQFLQDTLSRTPPPSVGMKRFKVYYGTMKGCNPPHFVLFVNKKTLCPANYQQFLSNSIRETFYPEAGLPIILDFRERKSIDESDETRKAAAGAKRAKESEYQSERRRIDRARGRRSK